MKTYRLKITGTVQGVFFRAFVKEKADELKLKGYARNLEDGRVEVIIESQDDEKLKEMIKACKLGPKQANIKNVEVEEIRHQGFSDFKILKF